MHHASPFVPTPGGGAGVVCSDGYDLVIDIEQVNHVFKKRGWQLGLSKEAVKVVEPWLNSRQVDEGACLGAREVEELSAKILPLDGNPPIIAVNGLFNRGKTYLLNKLTNMGLKSDKKYNTKGLSFKIPDNAKGRGLLLLDTAGTNSPLDVSAISAAQEDFSSEEFIHTTLDPDEKGLSIKEATARKEVRAVEDASFFAKRRERAIVNKKATELFLEKVIFALADMLIVVVNEMTWPDQQYIENLSYNLQNANREEARRGVNSHKMRQLIVVHNYRDVADLVTLKVLQTKYVTSCYHGELLEVNVDKEGGETCEIFRNTDNNMIHVFLGQDGTDAGEEYNDATVSYLLMLARGINVGKRDNILTMCCNISGVALDHFFIEPGHLGVYQEDGALAIKTTSPMIYKREHVSISDGVVTLSPGSLFVPKIDVHYFTGIGMIVVVSLDGIDQVIPPAKRGQPPLDLSQKDNYVTWKVNRGERSVDICGKKVPYYWPMSAEGKILEEVHYYHREGEKVKWLDSDELPYGLFSRTLNLPKTVGVTPSDWRFVNGQLQLVFAEYDD